MPIGRKKKFSEFGLSEPNRRVVPAYSLCPSLSPLSLSVPRALPLALSIALSPSGLAPCPCVSSLSVALAFLLALCPKLCPSVSTLALIHTSSSFSRSFKKIPET